MSKQFTKRIENFTCEHCGYFTAGNGYTNHCPKCLWSKHVDINPGDRASSCQGLMEPVGIEKVGEEYILTHRCTICKLEKRNKTQEQDDFEQILLLIKQQSY